MIMYYEERFIAHEMDTVLASMRDAYATKYGKPADDIHGVLIEWGRKIKKRFDANNLHLTARKGHGELVQVVESLKSLNEISQQQHALLVSLNSRVIELETQLRTSGAPVQQQQQPTPTQQQQQQQQPTPTPQQPTPEQPTPEQPTQPQPTPPVRPAPANTPHLLPPGRGLSGGPASKYNTCVKASRFFLDCLEKDGNLPAGLDDKRRSECAKVLSAFKAMMMPEEADLLATETSMQAIAPTINAITCRLVTRIKEQYGSISKPVPKRFGKGEVKVNTLIDNIRDSKLIVDSQAFAAWRARGGQGSSSSSQGGVQGGSQGGGGDDDGSETEEDGPPRKSPRKLGPPAREAAREEEDSEGGSSPSRGSDEDYQDSDEDMPVSQLAGLGSPTAPITFD